MFGFTNSFDPVPYTREITLSSKLEYFWKNIHIYIYIIQPLLRCMHAWLLLDITTLSVVFICTKISQLHQKGDTLAHV